MNQPEVMIVMIGKANKAFDADGKLIDETSQGLIRKMLDGLVQLTRQLKK